MLSACLYSAAASAAPIYHLTTLAAFDGTNGRLPFAGLIADASGNLYGTTEQGGAGYGTVFEVAAGTHALSALVTFNGTNGAFPRAGLIADASGNLFGTTAEGGANDYGTVFEVAAGTHELSTLATFDGANGREVVAGLIADASGNLFGTTKYGGDLTLNFGSGDGIVFEVAAVTHTLSTLVTFNIANGAQPYAGLLADASGNLFGTTHLGGANGKGTVFEVANDVTHKLSTLLAFDGANGAFPDAGLIADANGNLYGTTQNGGANGRGTVFELAAGTHRQHPGHIQWHERAIPASWPDRRRRRQPVRHDATRRGHR